MRIADWWRKKQKLLMTVFLHRIPWYRIQNHQIYHWTQSENVFIVSSAIETRDGYLFQIRSFNSRDFVSLVANLARNFPKRRRTSSLRFPQGLPRGFRRGFLPGFP